ncbi:unnamed protein product [Rotaria sp. Silwood2]|nr:unnamed protein product [Rotaria sp. Silwood2]CAF4468649.1 unnamed protein product [Rotaria sp. Silwood2]
MFDAQTTILSLEDVIEPNIWNWAPVQRTSVYLQIWNAHEKWSGLSSLIQSMEDPLRIIQQRKRCWTLFVDQYVSNKTELMKLPNSLAQTTIVNYLPNMTEVTNLKVVFDEYDQEESLGVFSKLRKNDERTTSDDWLNDICNTATPDICRIVTGLSISHVYQYQSWIEYKNQYIESKRYFKALLCHKMAEYINGNNETRWFINGIEDLDPVAFELLDGVRRPYDWKNMGDQYYKDGKFIIALNCYLFCDPNSADQIIMQQAQSPLLALSVQLMFNTVVYKRTRGNDGKVCKNKSVDLFSSESP